MIDLLNFRQAFLYDPFSPKVVFHLNLLQMQNAKQLLCAFLMTLLPILLSAQSAVRGKVVDVKGEALANVAIQLMPDGRGTVSDQNGNFSFDNVQAGSYRLQSSSLGFQFQEREIQLTEGNPLNITIAMKSTAFVMDELVDEETAAVALAILPRKEGVYSDGGRSKIQLFPRVDALQGILKAAPDGGIVGDTLGCGDGSWRGHGLVDEVSFLYGIECAHHPDDLAGGDIGWEAQAEVVVQIGHPLAASPLSLPN